MGEHDHLVHEVAVQPPPIKRRLGESILEETLVVAIVGEGATANGSLTVSAKAGAAVVSNSNRVAVARCLFIW